MFPKQKGIEDGFVYSLGKKKFLQDCISITAVEDGFVLNKDGSIAAGFEVSLPEEETLNEDGLASIVHEFSGAAKSLPVGTVIQKIDIYDQASFHVAIPSDAPFFYQKTLEHQEGKKILKHRCFIFLQFFPQEINPVTSFLGWGYKFFKSSFSDLTKAQTLAKTYIQEFVSAMPPALHLERLSNQAVLNLIYQYTSLTFHRELEGFEREISVTPESVYMGVRLKSVTIKEQAEDLYYAIPNNLGIEGVTSPFTWRTAHFAAFPHIVCQKIEIIADKKFRKSKRFELGNSADLKLVGQARELAKDIQQRMLALEKELNQKDTQIVKMSYHVFVWDVNEEVLQSRTDQIKSAFGKIGIRSKEEAEYTISSFLASIPGGNGFLEGFYMPLESAVCYMNLVSPKRGDKKGILLNNRHGHPIYYDPFKYNLDNQHAFVFGPTGSGKSFFNGKMIKDRFYAGHTVIVIDSGGTYRRLFEALGGTYIEYRPDKPLAFNPFLFKKVGTTYKPASDKIAFLANFIAKIWKGDLAQNPLSELEYALLSKFLTNYYKGLRDKDIPSLIGFCGWLKAHVKEEDIADSLFHIDNFLLILEPFTEGIYKEHFNALEISYPEDERLICFELKAVKNDSKLYPLVVKVLFDYVLELVQTQSEMIKFIDIEECWKMLDDSTKDYIQSFYREERKSNLSIRVLTQTTDEVKDSKIAAAMKNNAATFILLYNDKQSVRRDIADFLGMNAFDMEKYASLRRRDSYTDGYREVFIKEMDTSSVWRIETSLYEHGILTSRPDERNAITNFIKSTGSVRAAVTAWINDILKAEPTTHG
jgi:type IV secretory pathway VirB4 component